MSSENCCVSWDFLSDFITDAFECAGVPREDAVICTDVLLEADRRGIVSHGVNRFKPIYLDRIKDGIQNPVTNFEIIRETPTTAVIDGHDGMGQVIGYRATKLGIEKAKKYGMSTIAVRKSCHYGIAGYYVSMATEAGLIGITGTNARPAIAPAQGSEAMMGTNPLTFGLPTDEPFPFLLDCATSIVQRATIEAYARRGEPTPPGTVIASDGSEMTDSAEILKALLEGRAALCPIGSSNGNHSSAYKGYGYATVVEILSAALQQGSYMKMLSGIGPNGEKVPHHLGHFFIFIDPEAFMGLDAFKKTAGDILRALRSSRLAPGFDRIYTAGEKEYLSWQRQKDTGLVIDDRSIQRELMEVRDNFGLTKYRFPFE